jgi:hypothetical protein
VARTQGYLTAFILAAGKWYSVAWWLSVACYHLLAMYNGNLVPFAIDSIQCLPVLSFDSVQFYIRLRPQVQPLPVAYHFFFWRHLGSAKAVFWR